MSVFGRRDEHRPRGTLNAFVADAVFYNAAGNDGKFPIVLMPVNYRPFYGVYMKVKVNIIYIRDKVKSYILDKKIIVHKSPFSTVSMGNYISKKGKCQ